MWDKLKLKHWPVRWRTQLMTLIQLLLSLAGFAIVLFGLSQVAIQMQQQQQAVAKQQTALSEQTTRFQVQRDELNSQQQAIAQQQDALTLQQAVFRVYQAYPRFLFWRLASTTSLSDNDARNGDSAQEELVAAAEEIRDVDVELADAIDLFMLDLEDFNSKISQAIAAFRSGDDSQGRSLVSSSQNHMISMTSMLEVVLFVTDEVVTEAGDQVSASLASLTQSVASVEDSGRIMADSVEQVSAASENVVNDISERQSQVFVVLAVILVLSVLIGMALSRSIIAPLNRLKETIETVNHQNDLTLRGDDSRRDDMGRIAASINAMLTHFREMIGSVRTGASQIAAETQTQTQGNEQVRDALVDLNTEVDSVATAINEMTATVKGINEITTEAAQAAQDSSQHCEQGRSQAAQSSQAVGKLNQQLTETGDRLTRLESRTEQIYAVVDVIQGVSEQTNLLALNAAIEAARAGEQGRGFAVVADEVRTLAQRTEQSSGEIKQMVEEFAQEVNTTVASVGEAKTAAQSAADYSDAAQASTTELLQSVQSIRQLNEQISQSTQEQTDATTALDSSVTRISDLLAEIAEKANAMTDAMNRLTESTVQLEAQSQQFRT